MTDIESLQNLMYAQTMMLQARIEMEAMIAANACCQARGEIPLYDEDKFTALIEKHGVHHNAIITMMHPNNR